MSTPEWIEDGFLVIQPILMAGWQCTNVWKDKKIEPIGGDRIGYESLSIWYRQCCCCYSEWQVSVGNPWFAVVDPIQEFPKVAQWAVFVQLNHRRYRCFLCRCWWNEHTRTSMIVSVLVKWTHKNQYDCSFSLEAYITPLLHYSITAADYDCWVYSLHLLLYNVYHATLDIGGDQFGSEESSWFAKVFQSSNCRLHYSFFS